MNTIATRSFNPRETLRQIGGGNILAISGGQFTHTDDRLDLPVRYGYSVRIQLAADDTYVVQRVFRRGAREWVKAEWTDVYADQIGDIAYTASCYRD